MKQPLEARYGTDNTIWWVGCDKMLLKLYETIRYEVHDPGSCPLNIGLMHYCWVLLFKSIKGGLCVVLVSQKQDESV